MPTTTLNTYAEHLVVCGIKTPQGEVIKTHVRFGSVTETAPYDVANADLVLCNDSKIAKRYDVLKFLGEKSTFVLNSTLDKRGLEKELPYELKDKLISRKASSKGIYSFTHKH